MAEASAPSARAVWPLLVAYVAAFVLALTSSAAFVVIAVVLHTGSAATLPAEAGRFALSLPGLLGVAAVDAAVLGAVTAVAGRWAGRGVLARRLSATRASALGVVAAVVGMVSLSLACGAAVDLLSAGRGGVMESIGAALRSATPLQLVLACVAIAAAPAMAEECFFRGLLLTRLVASIGRWPAILASAAAFGLFHVDPVQGSVAFVAGVFLGWVAERFGGIRPTVVAHGLNNAVFVLFAWLAPTDGPPTTRASMAVTAGAGAVWVGSVLVLRSGRVLRAPDDPTTSISAS